MEEKYYQIAGLGGFIVAGFLFIAVGVRSNDVLTIIASIIWTLSCLVWLIPLLKKNQS